MLTFPQSPHHPCRRHCHFTRTTINCLIMKRGGAKQLGSPTSCCPGWSPSSLTPSSSSSPSSWFPYILLSWVVSFIPNTNIIITIYGLNAYDYRSKVYNDKEDRDPDLIRQPEDRALTSERPKSRSILRHRSSNHTSNNTKGSIIKVSYKYPPSTDAPIILVNNQT